jgi:hypothetical protein
MVGSFYDPELDEGCAFEELISFHGGIGGTQTRPFILAPVTLPAPDEPLVGAERVHQLLSGWRWFLQGDTRGSAAEMVEVGPSGPDPMGSATGDGQASSMGR